MPVMGGSGLPLDNFKLEVAFASGPFDAAPTWTDITQYWVQSQQSQITRGRTSELDTVQTGTLNITLDNTDGRFTVGNSSSPYYPNVKLRKQIRVSYTEAAVTYYRFKGYVDEWPTQWPTGDSTYAWAQVRASDRFKPLGTPRTLRSVPQEEILMSGPQGYWTLGEPAGATSAGDTSGNDRVLPVSYIGDVGGTLTFAAATGPGTDGMSAPAWAAAATAGGGFILASPATYGAAAGCSLEFCLNTSNSNSGRMVLVGSVLTGPGFFFSSGVSGIAVSVLDTGGNTSGSSGLNVQDGKTHYVAVTATPNVAGATFRCYVDGTLQFTFTTTGSMTSFLSASLPTFKGVMIGGTDDALFPYTGSLSHVAVGGYILSPTTITRHAAALSTGFAGESTGARVGRVADWCNVATGDRVIDTGNTTSVRHVDTTGKTAQGFLQELADTEGGLVFMDTQGRLRFQQRGVRVNATAALTLDASNQQVSQDVMYRSNDQFLLNDVTYDRTGGITYRAVDTTSIGDYGQVSVARETYTTSDNEVRDHATWVVSTQKTPTARIEALGVDLMTDTASRANALGLDLSSKVTVTNMPTAAPGSSSSVFVEGYTETISTAEWTLSLNTSPADLYSPLWQLGVAGFSELGVTTTLNF